MNKVGNLTLKNIIPFKNITYPFNSANKTQGRIQRLRPTARRGTSELEELKEERKRELLNDEAPIEIQNVEFEKPLKIVSYPDPRLRAPNARIKMPATGLNELAEEMFKIMYNDDGVGLAAPQVGVNVRMMVFNPGGIAKKGDKGKEMVLINPEIIKFSKDKFTMEEGCLSFYNPKVIRGDVERPSNVRIKAKDINGKKILMNLDGIVSRIFQHEFDHLKGVLFFERMTNEVLESVKDDLVLFEEKFIKENPNVPIQRV